MRRREAVHRFVFPAEVAGARVTAMFRHVVKRERRAAHQLLRFFQADALKKVFRAAVSHLAAETAQVTRGNMDRVGDLFHRRAARGRPVFARADHRGFFQLDVTRACGVPLRE